MPATLVTGTLLVAALFEFVELRGPAGQRLFLNPTEITSLRDPSRADRQYFPPGTHCVVVMVNGKFVAVTQTCDEVRDRVQAARPLSDPRE